MRALIVSDVHGNLAALETVLARAPAHDQLWCLGDLVDYGPEPEECVTRLRELGALCVVGNHDQAVLAGAPGDGWSDRQLSPASLDYLASIPPERTFPDGVSARHTAGPGLRPPRAADLADVAGDLLLIGHTHLALIHRIGRRQEVRWLSPPRNQPIPLGRTRAIVNPGSVGYSFADPGRAEAMLFDSTDRTLTWLSYPYPVDSVVERLIARGAPAPAVAGQRLYAAGTLPPMRQTLARHRAWATLRRRPR